MTNLSRYSGNFVNFADNEFAFRGSIRRSFSGISLLDLNVSCQIGIFPTDTDTVTIEIDTTDPDEFSISRDGSVVEVRQKMSNDSVVSFNGGSYTCVTGVMSIINGRVFVNGQEVNPNQPNAKPKPQSRIKIFAPHNVDLSADLNGSSILASKVVFRKASIKVSGQSTVGLATKTLKLKVSGQGDNFVVLKGGDLSANLAGQGSVRVKGEYESVDLCVSGQGNIHTEGACNGDYDASVSGMGSIVHSGAIYGRKRKSVTGMGSISI